MYSLRENGAQHGVRGFHLRLSILFKVLVPPKFAEAVHLKKLQDNLILSGRGKLRLISAVSKLSFGCHSV